MGTPYHLSFACIDCRKSFKRLVDPLGEIPEKLPCPDCGKSAINLGRHFKPPKRSNTKQWLKVKFLVEHGFCFQRVYAENYEIVPYPDTIEEAKEFVEKYKKHAIQSGI